jgi:hypothetical protein
MDMRTIFVRVSNEASPSYAPVLAELITSTTFTIDSVHPDFIDDTLEFGPGDNVRCKTRRVESATADDRGRAHRLSSSRQ